MHAGVGRVPQWQIEYQWGGGERAVITLGLNGKHLQFVLVSAYLDHVYMYMCVHGQQVRVDIVHLIVT